VDVMRTGFRDKALLRPQAAQLSQWFDIACTHVPCGSSVHVFIQQQYAQSSSQCTPDPCLTTDLSLQRHCKHSSPAGLPSQAGMQSVQYAQAVRSTWITAQRF
jgi:hypothetical protein